MLILLPPSEGKWSPRRGKALDLAGLSNPGLTQTRSRVLHALVELCRADPAQAQATLGLPPGLSEQVVRNTQLPDAPTAAAARIYTGVLYDALDLATLTPPARRRAQARIRVVSSLFGLVTLTDRIPAYRLSGNVSLPDIGTVASAWRTPLAAVLGPVSTDRLVVDLRSGTYAGFWRPAPDRSKRVVSMRVLYESEGRRTIVSHFNKATKGRLVRAMLEDGSSPETAGGLTRLLRELGWQVENRPGPHPALDVVVSEL